MKHGELEFQHRGIDVENISARLVEKWIRRDRDTQPNIGEASQTEKSVAAHMALREVGELVDVLAGWAIDHVIGEVVDEDVEAYREDRSPFDNDDHKYEALAADYEFASPLTNRRIFTRLMSTGVGAFPTELQLQAVHALEALDAGEVKDFVKPETTEMRKFAYSLKRCQNTQPHLLIHETSFDELLHDNFTPIRNYAKNDAYVMGNVLEAFKNIVFRASDIETATDSLFVY